MLFSVLAFFADSPYIALAFLTSLRRWGRAERLRQHERMPFGCIAFERSGNGGRRRIDSID
jgi:hypothetical protein